MIHKSDRHHGFLPTIIIAVVYLTSDFLLDGPLAVVPVIGAGVLQLLYLRYLKNYFCWSVLIEGIVLGAVVLAGDTLAKAGYSGAEFPIIELILAAVLIISTSAGNPWLEKMMKRSSGITARIDKFTSYSFGILFAAHGSVLTGMIITSGRIHIIPAIVLFLVLYLITFMLVRRQNEKKAVFNRPGLRELKEGNFELTAGGEVLGVIMAENGRVFSITQATISENCETHIFLNKLETALLIQGVRSIRFIDWADDTIQLEISGYRKVGESWQKPIYK